MTLLEAEVQLLREALDDEYMAFSTYDQVISDFGEVPPFINIRDAEGRHIEALCGLFREYGLSIPENTWPGRVKRYPTLRAACEAAVAAEVANGEMYERLLAKTPRPDILGVLRNLQAASQRRHLPAFERCVSQTANAGGCGGRGRRRGRHGRG